MWFLPRRLKQARKAAKLTQEKLGVLAGLDELVAGARINQYERGRHEPNSLMVQNLAKVLHLPVAYFFADDDEAELLLRFHRMKPANRRQVLGFMIETGDC